MCSKKDIHRCKTEVALPCATDDLVDRFAVALKAKLRTAEAKHGWNNAWAKPDWMMDCLRDLLRQVATGDPLGVAVYAAFCWHHGWATAMPDQMKPEAAAISADKPEDGRAALVERMAEAIYSETLKSFIGNGPRSHDWTSENEGKKERYYEIARAALAAMTERAT